MAERPVAGERAGAIDQPSGDRRDARLRRWSAIAPVPLSIGLLAAWITVGGLAAGIWAVVTGSSVGDDGPQLMARLAGSFLVLALLWRAGWLREAGVATVGSRRAWLVGLVATAYLVPADVVAMFGVDGLRALPDALAAAFPEQWAIQASVGFAEELMFRGLLLVVLAAAWGRTGRGGLAVAIGVGVLFGVPHLIVLLGGIDPAIATLNAVAAIVSGTWFAALVLAYRTIWPLVVVHAATNLAVLALPMTTEPVGYVRLMLVDVPLLVFGAWLVIRRAPARVR